ncbi:MAG TPA: SPASM domain-containing protein [Candidatus Saccharimonadia bacterium]|nr:SPASM domain-containing protein [Candidatus Saccharimonadia bacterium]
MALTEATKANLRRKSGFIDDVQRGPDGAPMPSWLDLNLTELCNRSAGSKRPCVFCPRIDAATYPNQALHMPLGLVKRIRTELLGLDFKGAVVLCGFGEPMLHPAFLAVVAELCGHGWRVELVTNGDRLTEDGARDLARLGLDCIVVSMYDGPHQVLRFKAMLDGAGLVEGDGYILRDRWHTEEDGFGLKLTNRAGAVTMGKQDAVQPERPCHYLAYQMTVDWNGDVLLCVQDWSKRVRYGNLVHQNLWEIWTSPAMHKRRRQLFAGREGINPCSNCNTDGTLHGFNHVKAWQEPRLSSATVDLPRAEVGEPA